MLTRNHSGSTLASALLLANFVLPGKDFSEKLKRRIYAGCTKIHYLNMHDELSGQYRILFLIELKLYGLFKFK